MKDKFKKIYAERKQFIADRVDSIVDTWNTIIFSDYICRKGGDMITYRVYGDGKSEEFRLTEK